MGLQGSDVVLITAFGTQYNQRIMNTFPYVVDGPQTGNPITDDLIAVGAEFCGLGVGANDRTTNYLAMFGPEYVLNWVRVQRIAPQRSVLVDITMGDVGTNASSATTCNLAAVITKRTVLSGRRYVSTSHFGGIPANATVGGNITAAYKVFVDAFSGGMLVPLNIPGVGLTLTWGIYHKAGGGPNFDEIIQTLSPTTTRVMRRRTVGLGE